MKLTCLECSQVNRVPQERLSQGPVCATCGAKLVSGKVAEIDADTLAKAVRNDDLPLVVDFWAPWCGPCRMMAPEFAKAAETVKGRVRLAKLNTEVHPRVAADFAIRGIPTMIRFRSGREAARQSGAQGAAAIAAWAMT